MHTSTGPAIWTYWETPRGGRRPPYLDACETSIRRQAGGLPVHVVSDENADRWIGDLPATWTALTPVQRSDYVRPRLVERFGGIWVDADTIAFRPLASLLHHLDDDVTFVGYGDDGVHNGLFAGDVGSPLLQRWMQAQDDLLADGEPAELSWNALGSELLTPLTETQPWHRIPYQSIAPIGWRDWRLFLSRTYPTARVLAHEPVTVMLYNAQLAAHVGDESLDDLIRGRHLLGRLLRSSLGLEQLMPARARELAARPGDLVRRLGDRRRYLQRKKHSE